jgi:hypothetical protein
MVLRVVVEKHWLYFQACFKTVIPAKAGTHSEHQKPSSAQDANHPSTSVFKIPLGLPSAKFTTFLNAAPKYSS